jgi:hypothetical protein
MMVKTSSSGRVSLQPLALVAQLLFGVFAAMDLPRQGVHLLRQGDEAVGGFLTGEQGQQDQRLFVRGARPENGPLGPELRELAVGPLPRQPPEHEAPAVRAGAEVAVQLGGRFGHEVRQRPAGELPGTEAQAILDGAVGGQDRPRARHEQEGLRSQVGELLERLLDVHSLEVGLRSQRQESACRERA